MRKFGFLLLSAMFLFSCQNNQNTQVSNSEQSQNIPAPVEEKPDIFTEPSVESNIGKIIYDSNSGLPKSSNKTIPLKSLAKLVKEHPQSKEIIILYNKAFSSGDYSNDIKLVYDRNEQTVIEITISSNIKDVYDNITDKVITAAANDKECTTLYCLTSYSKSEMKTDFSERTIDAVGPKPKQDPNDYSVKEVVDYIKNNNTSAKVEFLEWSKVSSIGSDWVVRAKYKITNNGQKIIDNSWYYIQNNAVVKTKKIE